MVPRTCVRTWSRANLSRLFHLGRKHRCLSGHLYLRVSASSPAYWFQCDQWIPVALCLRIFPPSLVTDQQWGSPTVYEVQVRCSVSFAGSCDTNTQTHTYTLVHMFIHIHTAFFPFLLHNSNKHNWNLFLKTAMFEGMTRKKTSNYAGPAVPVECRLGFGNDSHDQTQKPNSNKTKYNIGQCVTKNCNHANMTNPEQAPTFQNTNCNLRHEKYNHNIYKSVHLSKKPCRRVHECKSTHHNRPKYRRNEQY